MFCTSTGPQSHQIPSRLRHPTPLLIAQRSLFMCRQPQSIQLQAFYSMLHLENSSQIHRKYPRLDFSSPSPSGFVCSMALSFRSLDLCESINYSICNTVRITILQFPARGSIGIINSHTRLISPSVTDHTTYSISSLIETTKSMFNHEAPASCMITKEVSSGQWSMHTVVSLIDFNAVSLDVIISES